MSDNIPPELVQQFNNLVDSAVRLRTEMDPLSGISQKNKEQADKAGKALEKFGNSLGTMASSFTKAETGTSKYASGVEAATGAIGDMASKVPFVGKVLDVFITGYGKLAANSLKQNDALIKAYQSLSKYGSVYNSSMSNLLDDLQRVGLGSENAEKLINVISKISPELAAFGLTAGEGRKRLTEVFGYTLGNTERQLMRFGYTTEDMLETTGSYLASLSMSNKSRLKSDGELNSESVKYMQTLAELSMLTGQSRDTADKARRAQENDLRFQMMLNKMEHDDAEKARKMIQMTTLVYGKEAAEGMKSVMVNQGRAVDDFGAGLYQLIGQDGIQRLMSTMKKEGDSTANTFEYLKSIAPVIAQRFEQFAPVIGVSNDAMKDFILNIETYKGVQSMSVKDQATFQKMRQALEKQASDDRLDMLADQTFAEREAKNALERLTFLVGNGAVAGVTAFATMANQAAKMLAKVVRFFGGPDLVDSFETVTNLNEANEVAIRQRQKLNKLEDEERKLKEDLEAEESKEGSFNYDPDYIAHLKSKISTNRESQSSARTTMNRANEMQQTMRDTATRDDIKSGKDTSGVAVGDKGSQLEGLKLKPGSDGLVHRSEKKLDPKLIELANKIQSEIPGLLRFTSFDDNAHANSKKSLHPQGKALDFTLDHKPTVEEGAELVKKLREMGFGKAIDEYNFPSPGAVGPGHIHAQLQAKNGGIFSGPIKGYNVTLHGDEMVTPVNKGVTKQPLSAQPTNTPDQTLTSYLMAMVEKLENLVELQSQTNRTSEEHLQYAKSN